MASDAKGDIDMLKHSLLVLIVASLGYLYGHRGPTDGSSCESVTFHKGDRVRPDGCVEHDHSLRNRW